MSITSMLSDAGCRSCIVLYHTGVGGFLPAVKQIANVASLPGIVGVSEVENDLCIFNILV